MVKTLDRYQMEKMLEATPPEILVSSRTDHGSRGQWGKKFDYILSLVGFCVGLGNLWRFPYLCNRNGGGAFLIPFFFFLIVCGLPMFFLEVTIGQFSGKGAGEVWEICPMFRGIGIGMTIVSLLITLYYCIILAWSIYYIIMSCATTLPWTTCENWWNTPLCVEDMKHLRSNGTSIFNISTGGNKTVGFFTPATATFSSYEILSDNTSGRVLKDLMNGSRTSVEEFWRFNTLRESSGLDSVGEIQWHLALCLLGAWFIVFFCLVRGVRSVGKVVYVTATLPYLLLTILLIRGLTLPGAVDGIIYYLKPDFNKLLDIQVWLEACLQVFYSLGPAWGGLITMSSYNKFNNNCLRDCIVVTFISEGTSIFAGFVIFTVLGVMAHNQHVPISEVVQSGPGLGFVAYPEALLQLPIPQLWSFIFFTMLLTVGLDTQFMLLEVVLTTLMDAFPKVLLKRRALVTAALCAVCFFIGLPACCNGGIFIFQVADWYVAALILIFGILECVVVSWVYGFYRLDKDVEMMLGRSVPRIFKILLGIVTPLILSIATVLALKEYKMPMYGSYKYPWYTSVIGWVWASLPIIPIPFYMIKELCKAKSTGMNRLWTALTPSSKWEPNCPTQRAQMKWQPHQPPSLRRSLYSIFQ